MTTTISDSPAALTALDRCDRCGAQAYVRVILGSGDLLFCAHHGREFEPKLREVATDIHDESTKLAAPAPANTASSR